MSLQIETQAFQFNNTVTGLSSAVFNSVSAISLSGVFYGSGSNLSLPSNATFSTLNILSTLNVTGSAYFYNTSNLTVSAALIYFGEGNTANLLDLGIATHFTGPLSNGNTNYQHTGFVRRANQGSPGAWTLFSGLTTEPGTYSVNGINWNDPYITVDSLSANVLGNLSGSYVTVGTGNSNQWNTAYQSISSQPYALISSTSSIKTILGSNSATGQLSLVAGGYQNAANGLYSNVNGGTVNIAGSAWATVGGGNLNQALSGYSVVAGGWSNCATNWASTVNGGYGNRALGSGSIVGGGLNNTSSGNYSGILGGQNNSTNGLSSVFILGSNITAPSANYTYVNNLSSQGLLAANGGSSNNWNSVYSYVNTNSATDNPAYNIATFSTLSSQAYTLVSNTSSIQPIVGNNIATSWGTILLSHFDTTQYLLDSSPYNIPYVLPIAGTGFSLDTTTKISGAGSVKTTGSGVGALYRQKNGILNLGTGDFTIELWVYPRGYSSGLSYSILNYDNYQIGVYASSGSVGNPYFTDSNSTQNVATGVNLNINTWYHYAIVRKNNITKFFINGTVYSTTYTDNSFITANLNNNASSAYQGLSFLDTSAGFQFLGNIDELRIIKGYALYTANFTTPTPPLSAFTPNAYTGSLIASGSANNAIGNNSTILNGSYNIVHDCNGLIGNGTKNTSSGYYSSIINGYGNVACGCTNVIINGNSNKIYSNLNTNNKYSSIENGVYNTVSGNYSTTVNGLSNISLGCYQAILNGCCNCLSYSHNSWIGNGCKNSFTNSGVYNVILTGVCNTASTNTAYALFGTGYCNNIATQGSYQNYNILLNGLCNGICIGVSQSANLASNTLLNGCCNVICGSNSGNYGSSYGKHNTIANGCNNKLSIISYGYYNSGSCSAYSSTACIQNSLIFGGCANQIYENNQNTGTTTCSNYSTTINGVSGFIGNNSSFSTLENGCCNCITSSNFSTVANGICNTISGTYSCNSTIVNGCKNYITSFNSTIVNGTNNNVKFDSRTTSNLPLLYHFDTYGGIAGNPTFYNSALNYNNVFIPSSVGTVSAISTPSAVKFGAGAVQFVGGLGEIANNFSPAIGTNNFSIDFWYYIQSGFTTPQATAVFSNPTGSVGGPVIYVSNTSIYYRTSVTGSNLITGTITLGQYNHIALARYNNVVTLYVNGVAQGTYTDSTNYSTANFLWFGGTGRSYANPAYGYLDELRVYSGYSAYTGSNFTPPTSPYTIGSSTILGGYNNNIVGDSSYLAGNFNSVSATNAFVLGSNITATKDNYTYVNNLSVQGNIASNTAYTATAYLSADTSTNIGADLWLPLASRNDPNGWITNVGTYPSLSGKITPTIPGYYYVAYQAALNNGSGSGAQNNIQIRKNGTNTISIAQMPLYTASGAAQTITTTAVTYMNGATDSLNVSLYNGGSGSQTIRGTSDGNWTKVEVYKIN